MRAAGGNHLTIRKYAEKIWRIPTDHFDPDQVRDEALQRRSLIPLETVLVEHSTYARAHLKKRLFKEGLKSRRCEMCGQDERWRGRWMALILDHINGVWDDNRLENLRIICPNCAATLDTHCGKQNQCLREPRSCLLCGAEFHPAYPSHRYCSRYCGHHAPRSDRGQPRPERRKVARPPYAQLLREVHAIGYLATGRRYGVTDNAIRKWIRQYEKERAARSDPAGPLTDLTDGYAAA
jgi:hypothetical protein